jgi:D-sedoheptulose 7-phosphate isomerase
MATDAERRQLVAAIFDETMRVHEEMKRMDLAPLLTAADRISRAVRGDRKLLAFGNGGSAADAQHVAAELVGRFTRERRALPAIALTTDTSILTSVANDSGYDRVFVRQVEALGRPGDVALGISTSGGSASVVSALQTARRMGLTTVALTGRDGGAAGAAAEIHINVPHQSTPRVQEVHRTILHVICELIERDLDETKAAPVRNSDGRGKAKGRRAEREKARGGGAPRALKKDS